MSGERYEIFMARSAHRKYKRFPPNLQERIKEESEIVGNDPYACGELKVLYAVFGVTILFRIALNIGLPIEFLKKRMKLKSCW